MGICGATKRTNAYGEAVVRYWSVYDQQWREATDRSEVSDRDHAALDATDRALIATLPETGE